VHTARIAIPSVELVGDQLSYRVDENVSFADAPATEGALDVFLELSDPQGVLAFAKKFGVLGLCGEHGKPAPGYHTPSVLCEPCASSGTEPVSRWLEYAAAACELLKNAVRLHQAKRTTTKEWWDSRTRSITGSLRVV